MKSKETLTTLSKIYAMYAGNMVEGNDGNLYFCPEEDIACEVDDILRKLNELQEENDRLYGENARLKRELKDGNRR